MSLFPVDHLSLPTGSFKTPKVTQEILLAISRVALHWSAFLLNTNYINWRTDVCSGSLKRPPHTLVSHTKADTQAAPLCSKSLQRPPLWIKGCASQVTISSPIIPRLPQLAICRSQSWKRESHDQSNFINQELTGDSLSYWCIRGHRCELHLGAILISYILSFFSCPRFIMENDTNLNQPRHLCMIK